MDIDQLTYVVVAVVLLTTVFGGVTVVSAFTPNRVDLCPVCGEAFERYDVAGEPPDVASDLGMGEEESPGRSGDGFDVVESDARVTITSGGDARWRVTNRLRWTSDVVSDRVSAEPSLLTEYTREKVREDAKNVSVETTVDGVTRVGETDTVTVTYTVSDVEAERLGSVAVLDFLHRGHTIVNLTVDRFTLTVPPGTTFTSDPGGATVEGRTATWSGQQYVGTYVTYAPADDPFRGLWTYAALVTVQSPVGTDIDGHLSSAVLLLLVLAGVVGLHSWLGNNPLVLGAFGVFPTVAVGFVVLPEVYDILVGEGAVTMFPLGVTVAVLGAWSWRGRDRSRHRPTTAAVVAAGAGLASGALLVGLGVPPVRPRDFYLPLLVVPIALMFPLGYAVGQPNSWQRRLLLVATVTAVYALVAFLAGPRPILFGIEYPLLALTTAFFGFSPYVLGGLLAHTAEHPDGDSRATPR